MLLPPDDPSVPTLPAAPLSLGIAPGRSGLPRLVLRHLVDSRYASIAAGGPTWALRTASDVYSVAGGGAGTDLGDTERVLELLRAHGFVDRVVPESGAAHWMATPAGATAIEHRTR